MPDRKKKGQIDWNSIPDDVQVADKAPSSQVDWDAIPDESTPQKKSPVVSEPTLAAPSQEQQTGFSANNTPPAPQPIEYTQSAAKPLQAAGEMKNVFAPKYVPKPIADTKDAVTFLAHDYMANKGTAGGVQPIDDITNPNGSPEALRNYLNERFQQMNLKDPSHALANTIEADELRNNAQHIFKVQLANQELQTSNYGKTDPLHPIEYADTKNEKAGESRTVFDPVVLGMQLAINMGDKVAERDLVKYKQGQPVKDDRKVQYEASGYDIMHTGATAAKEANNEEGAQELIAHSDNPGDRLEKNNPRYFKRVWADQLGDYVKKKESNPLYGTIFTREKLTPEEIKDYGKKAGLKKYQIDQLTPEDVPTEASMYGQAAQSFYNTLTFSDENDPGGKFFTGKMPMSQKRHEGWKGVVGELSSGAGMVGAFMLQGGFTGSALKGAGILGDVAANAGRYERAANMIPIALTNYNQSYNASQELIGDDPKDAWKRGLYTAAMGTISTALMSIDPMTKIGSEILENNASKDLVNLLKKSTAESLSKEEFKTAVAKTMTKVAEVGGATAKHTASQAFIMGANKAAENIADMVFDPNHRHDVMDGVADAAISASVSMFLPSLVAGIKTSKAKTPLNTEIAYSIGSDPEKYIQQVTQDVANGKITPEDAQIAREGILNMKTAVARVPQENLEQQKLTEQQKKDYAFNLFQEQMLQNQLAEVKTKTNVGEQGEDKAQVDPINSRITELKKERDEILKNAGKEPAPVAPKAEEKPNQGTEPSTERRNEASSEQQAPATKEKTEEKVENNQKENIPLTPQENQTLKTNENGSIQNEEGRQSNTKTLNAQGGEEEANVRQAANSERGQQQEADRLLGEPKELPKDGQEQPVVKQPESVLKSRQKRKLKPDMPESPEVVAQDLPLPETNNKEFTPPQPKKPLHDMTGEELSAYHDELKAFNSDLEKKVLGENYQEYRKAQRTANNRNGAHEDRAAAENTIKKIEDALSPEQKNALFGKGMPEGVIVDHEAVKPFKDRVEYIEAAEDEKQLSDHIAHSLVDLNAAPKEFDKMTERQKLAFTAMKAAKRVIEERGYDGKKVTQEALKNAAGKFSDKEDAAMMLSKYLDFSKQKPQENASTQSKKQLKEGDKQSGEPEHARAQQAGGEAKAAEAKNSHSNIGGKAEEKINTAIPRKRKGKSWSMPEFLKRRTAALSEESHSIEEHIAKTMLAMNDKAPKDKWKFSSVEKDIPKGAEERRVAKQFTSDHPKALSVDEWSNNLQREIEDGHHPFGLNRMDSKDIGDLVKEMISKFPYKADLLNHIEELHGSKNAPEESVHKIPVVDHETGKVEFVDVDLNSPHADEQIARIYGAPEDEFPTGFDEEGHPFFVEFNKEQKEIEGAKMSDKDIAAIDNIIKEHTKENGELDFDNLGIALHGIKGELSQEAQDLINKIAPFDDNKEVINELITKIKEYNENSKPDNNQGVFGPVEPTAESNVGTEGAVHEQVGENGQGDKPASEGESAGEELNQATADERIVATNPSSEIKTPAAKEKPEPSLLEKKTNRLNELKTEHDDLNFRKEELETKLDHAYAKSKVDPAEVEELEKEISEKRQEIADKKRALDLKAREVEIQTEYSKNAEKARKAVDKLIGNKKALSSAIPFLNGETVRSVLKHAIDLYEQFGNLHIAADRTLSWAKEKFKGEEGIGQLTEDHVKKLIGPHTEPLTHEPIIKDADHLQYAKDLLEDIRRGDITYEEARQEVLEQERVFDKTKGNILNYVDYHLKQDEVGIRNAITRLKREQFGLNEEIPADKVTYDEVWQEAKNKIEKDPEAAQRLVDELAKHPRPVDALEDAILLHHNVALEKRNSDLNSEINKAADNLSQAEKDGDKVAALKHRAEIVEQQLAKAAVDDKMQQAYDVFKAVGTENARGLAFRRMMSDMKFTLVNMVSEKRAAANDGQPLNEKQQAEIEKLHQKITDTQRELDEYKKQKDAQIEEQTSQIIELQEKALAGKIKNKKSAGDKVQDWAKRIRSAIKNASSTSPRLETRKEVADALDDIAIGIESGDQLSALVKKAVKKAKDKAPDIDERHLEKEINKELINSGILESSKESRKAKDIILSGFFKDGRLDERLKDLNVAANRAKNQFDTDIKIDEQAKRTKSARRQDAFIKWQREFKLSNPLTIGKLTAAAATRLVTEAGEEVVGAGYTKLLPRLANGAIGEGNAGGIRVREYAQDMSRGLMLGMKDAAKIMTRGNEGKSDLDVLFGKGGDLPPEAMEFFGKLHSALKAPIKRAVFEKQLNKRLHNYAATGVDISDPMVQTQAMNDAYIDANRAIFMQDNKVANWYQKQIKNYEKGVLNKETGKIETPAKWKASSLQYLVPFVKVPSNIVAETAKLAYGLPYGAFQAAHAYFTGEVDKLTSDQRDVVMRNLKKGTIGAAAMALGLFASQNFGGFFQSPADEKKKKRLGYPRAMGIDTPFGKLPHWAGEAPLFQAMQLGATTWRVWHERVEGEEKGLPSGMVAAALGLLDEQPLMGQALRVGNVIRERGSKASLRQYFGELAKSTFVPAILDYAAKATDPADEGSVFHHVFDPENHRNPKTMLEHVESGIPGLREDLEEK